MSRVGRRRRHPQLTLVTGLGPAARASRSTTPRSAASAPAEGPGAADADMRPLSPRSRPPATAGRCTPASRSCADSAPAKPNACAPGSRPEPPSSATAANGLAASPRSRVVHQRHVAGSGRAAARHPAFRWANTGARQRQEQPPGHPPRVVGAKHLPRCLGAFAWRFNRRFALKTIDERLAIAATTTRRCPTAS